MPTQERNVLTERFWTVRVVRDFWFKGVWRQAGQTITVAPHVARNMIEAGQAVNTPDWPQQKTEYPWALQNVQPGSGGGGGGGGGVGSVNGLEGDISLVAGPGISVTESGQQIIIGNTGVLSAFGRAGNVVAQAGDYNANQISLVPPIGSWTTVAQALNGLDALAQPPTLQHGGIVVGAEYVLNFLDTASAAWSLNDTGSSIEISVTTSGGGGGLPDPTTTQGDLIVRGPTTVGRLGVGSDGQILTADSTQPFGIRWANPLWIGDGSGGSISTGNVDINGSLTINGQPVVPSPLAAWANYPLTVENGFGTVMAISMATARYSVFGSWCAIDITFQFNPQLYGAGPGAIYYVLAPPVQLYQGVGGVSFAGGLVNAPGWSFGNAEYIGGPWINVSLNGTTASTIVQVRLSAVCEMETP